MDHGSAVNQRNRRCIKQVPFFSLRSLGIKAALKKKREMLYSTTKFKRGRDKKSSIAEPDNGISKTY